MLLPILMLFCFEPKNKSGNANIYTINPEINPRKENVLLVIIENKDDSREYVKDITDNL